MDDIFNVRDPRGINISCSSDQWYNHVVSQREFMRNNLQAVSETLMLPDEIYQDPKHENREVYIKSGGGMNTKSYSNSLHTHVVVENINSSSSVLITAWPSAEIKKGLIDVKYPKK